MQRNLRALLNPKLVNFLEQKLEADEISPEECKEVIKEMMLREYQRKQVEPLPQKLKTKMSGILNWFDNHRDKHFDVENAKPAIGFDELAGTVRTRRF